MIRIADLVVERDGKRVLDGVNMTVPEETVTALLGPNGAGKSTLLRTCTGLRDPTTGAITVDEQSVADADPDSLHRKVGLVFQRPENQFVAPTVREDIAFGLVNAGIEEPTLSERVTQILDRFALTDLADRPCTALSGGEKQRVALADVLVLDPAYVLLDEPTTSLDGAGCRAVAQRIDHMTDAGRTVVLATHHVAFARAVADRFVVLDDGAVVHQGHRLPEAVAVAHDLRTPGLLGK
ncbi:MAG: energy-coupling factor ABC transporter ATP-binding protein [Salinarchaeum sp.]